MSDCCLNKRWVVGGPRGGWPFGHLQRRCVKLTLRCHLRHVLVGENMRPPRHMLPKAPCKQRREALREVAALTNRQAAPGLVIAHLTRAVSAAALHAWDARHSAARTPRSCGGCLAGIPERQFRNSAVKPDQKKPGARMQGDVRAVRGSARRAALVHAIWLPLVACHSGVHEVDDIRTDGREKDARKRHGGCGRRRENT